MGNLKIQVAGNYVPARSGGVLTGGGSGGLGAVTVATTGNVVLSGIQTVDAVALVAGDSVLVKSQLNPVENGVWVVQSGAWTRHTEFDTAAKIAGTLVRVRSGDANGGTVWATDFEGSLVVDIDPMAWWPVPRGERFFFPKVALKEWRIAYAHRRYQRANIATIGDSTTEGMGAGIWQSWPDRLGHRLQKTNTPTPNGFIAGGSKAWHNFWTYSGTGNAEYLNEFMGIGKRMMVLPSERSAERRFFGTSFDLFFCRDIMQGTPTITIDGVNYTGPDLNNPGFDSGLKWSSPALARGWHTVKITPQVGGEARIEGFKPYDTDETHGVHMFNGGNSGTTSRDWAGRATPQDARVVLNAWPNSYIAADPHLVIISLIHNDYGQQIDPAFSYQCTMDIIELLIEAAVAKSKAVPSMLLWIPPERTDVTPTNYTWEEYADNYKRIAREVMDGSDTMNIGVFDMRDYTHRRITDQFGFMYVDLVHPGNAGSQHYADIMAEVLDVDHDPFYNRRSLIASHEVADVPLTVSGTDGQTADLMQWVGNQGAVLARMDKDGKLREGTRRVTPLIGRLTLAQSSTLTTWVAMTLMAVNVEAGKTYRIRASGRYRTAATTTGIGLRIGGTATATSLSAQIKYFGVTTTTLNFATQTTIGQAVTPSTGVAAASTDYPFEIDGLIQVNAAGNLVLEFRSEVSGSSVTVQPDAFLELVEV